MPEYIEINGAHIEREFFEQNVREARTYHWQKVDASKLFEHVHCMICNLAIDAHYDQQTYRSEGGWVCGYCYPNFVRPSERADR